MAGTNSACIDPPPLPLYNGLSGGSVYGTRQETGFDKATGVLEIMAAFPERSIRTSVPLYKYNREDIGLKVRQLNSVRI